MKRVPWDPRDDAHCPASGKVRYLSESEARDVAAQRTFASRISLFVYWCQACHGPHLTKLVRYSGRYR